MITPPISFNVFVIAGIVRNVPMTEIFSGVWSFVLDIAILAGFIIVFPEIVLFLPIIGLGRDRIAFAVDYPLQCCLNYYDWILSKRFKVRFKAFVIQRFNLSISSLI